ncbi:glycine zipper 2TM domain-containing protein [Photobacterium rosenbergii]|uniref:Glycine zipper 2TM domain-containing protein n=1 Tax=Photobacterium rosenbergii TaxID=294936 RepID=A0ABU3ZK03_9GAMM|nr:glycine zipper 2TM domain-containing protein [Photobacterium rosenbergii]MDV5170450.1 glycine zipper 2TM domain-containing protein [Photobacterium rosenbergii]
MRKWLVLLLVLPLALSAAPYNRNQARPVKQVVFGAVDSVRYITHQEVIESQRNGWETLLGGVIGGLIGNQFGDGTGREVATAVGAVAGAGIAHKRQPTQRIVQYRLVELLIKAEDGTLIDVIQDVDSTMLFQPKDKVRILYFDNGVRVDKAYP